MENNVNSSAEVAKIDSDLKTLPSESSKKCGKNKGKFLYALTVGIIVTFMTIVDCLVAPVFFKGTSFMWIAFISWTLFSTYSDKEKLKAVIGFIIGYFSANGMIWISSGFEVFTGLYSSVLPIGTLVSGFLFNVLVARYGENSNKFLNSIPAMFLGMSFTFSGAGVGIPPRDLSLLAVILIYGVMGVVACFGCDFFAKKLLKSR